MKIHEFRCRNLNGYLNFNLKFNKDVSFLIGINGSGKTSVLKATMALLGPDIDWLVNSRYDSIAVHLKHDRRSIVISATRAPDGVLIEYRGPPHEARFTISDSIYKTSLRTTEDYVHDEDGEFVRIRETRSEIPDSIEPFSLIKALPTPIFLGLDRTTLPAHLKGNARARRTTAGRRPHATLRTFLDESVGQAEAIAVEANRQAYLLRSRRAAQLREEILLSLFSEMPERGATDLPRQADLRRYERMRRSLKDAFNVLGIDQKRTAASIDPFFSNLIDMATSLAKYKSFSDLIDNQHGTISDPAFYSWMNVSPRLSLIMQVEKFVSEFNLSEAEIFHHILKYLGIMNSFLADSQKHLFFKEDSSLAVRLPSGSPADVYYMSSGERQLFVLITTLMFSDDQARANAVIIDEPELSLHIKWQEMFVGALLEANPDIQLILATHSPSIIMDRDDACVDLA